MQYAYTGRANIVELPVVAKASGDPITAGTVNFYLAAKDGDNAGKWYRGSDLSWQVAESIAGAATHRADGHWYLSLPSEVWESGVRYRLYAKESGNLHISVGEDVVADIFSVWDEVITSVYHNVDSSAAYYLRRLYQTIVTRVAQCQGEGTNNTILLDSAASQIENYYKGQVIAIFAGTGAGQSRACTSYSIIGGIETATIGPAWATNPDVTSWFAILNFGSTVVSAIDNIDFSALMKTSLNAATPNLSGLLTLTGVTAGGTWTYQKLMKVLAAWTMGLGREKTGSPGVVEILDPDNGTTVIAELARSDTTPYKTVTVKI